MSDNSKDWKRDRDMDRRNKQAKRNVFTFVAAEKREGVEKRYY